MIIKQLCPALFQRQPEKQPNKASAARRHFASWQTSHVLFNKLLATSRRHSIPGSGCHKA
ncbi:hypothetical protein [Kingella oralis]|uniref:Uncharacterized protein n=1 Tax=Kingella oralis ATCC 51147 TaxID=629741 RepID=C4GJV6_9NEIS|nr:hypothetical protein [Kingella oralis]EEP68078.1 hypothetical protein GCWU000324_02329 [Kingella oralis ATCC 51147]QMT43166.1 hypothetical protein H3L93_02105 [Kingella oralis]